MEATDVIQDANEDTVEKTVVGLLKAKYFAIQEAIDAADVRHTKAVDGLNAPKAKEHIALHRIELLKANIEKARNALNLKKKELADVKEDLGEAKTEVTENAEDLHEEIEEAATRTDKLEDVEEKCKDAREMVFENKRKFHEATRQFAMLEYDLEAMTNRVNSALQRIAEVEDMKTTSDQQVAQVEKRGGKTAERELEKKAKMEALAKQIEDTDDVTEEGLKTIRKLQLKREYILDQIEYWNTKTERIKDEIDTANQEDCGSY